MRLGPLKFIYNEKGNVLIIWKWRFQTVRALFLKPCRALNGMPVWGGPWWPEYGETFSTYFLLSVSLIFWYIYNKYPKDLSGQLKYLTY